MSALAAVRPPVELRVGGLTPFTSIDYPGKLSAVVFVQGCAWRCGYCHNPHLQSRGGAGGPAWPDVMAWLRGRVGLLDAVVFSGGEPTMDPALGDAMAVVRALGLAVGLHSAGIHPRRLRQCLPHADWIGLDVKAPLDDDALHDRITGVSGSAKAARESLRMVIESGVDSECRTTVDLAVLDDRALLRLADGLARQGVRRYALQFARPVGAQGGAQLAGAAPAAATLARLHGMFDAFSWRSG